MDDISDLVTQKLKQENTYAQLKAATRAATEQILSENRTVPPPTFCAENQLLIQSLSEFFRAFNLKATATALEAETGTATLNLRRDLLLEEIGLDNDKVPEDETILQAMVEEVEEFGQVETVIEEEE